MKIFDFAFVFKIKIGVVLLCFVNEISTKNKTKLNGFTFCCGNEQTANKYSIFYNNAMENGVKTFPFPSC